MADGPGQAVGDPLDMLGTVGVAVVGAVAVGVTLAMVMGDAVVVEPLVVVVLVQRRASF